MAMRGGFTLVEVLISALIFAGSAAVIFGKIQTYALYTEKLQTKHARSQDLLAEVNLHLMVAPLYSPQNPSFLRIMPLSDNTAPSTLVKTHALYQFSQDTLKLSLIYLKPLKKT